MVLDFRFGHWKCPNREWGKGPISRWKWPFPHSRLGHSSAWNKNLRPLLNTNIPLISGKYGFRNHFWPPESRFLMSKSEKNAFFSKPFKLRILISWNPILHTFLRTKIKKITMDNIFSLDACSGPMWLWTFLGGTREKTPCIYLYELWTGIFFLTFLHFWGLSFSINRNHCTWVCKINIYPGTLEPARLNRSFDFVIYLKKTLTAFTALENSELRDDRKLRKSFAKMNFV